VKNLLPLLSGKLGQPLKSRRNHDRLIPVGKQPIALQLLNQLDRRDPQLLLKFLEGRGRLGIGQLGLNQQQRFSSVSDLKVNFLLFLVLDKMKGKTAIPQVVPPLNRPPQFQGHHIFETLRRVFDPG
jgi:hypothetical protein